MTCQLHAGLACWTLLQVSHLPCWQSRNVPLVLVVVLFIITLLCTGQDIADAAADRYTPFATIVSIPASADENVHATANDSSRDMGSDFPRVLHCSHAATVHLIRGLYLSNELFAVHWAGEWPSGDQLTREGSGLIPTVSDQNEAVTVKQGRSGSAGAVMPSPGQRLAIAMDTFFVVNVGQLGWSGEAHDHKQVQENLVRFCQTTPSLSVSVYVSTWTFVVTRTLRGGFGLQLLKITN